MVIPLSNSNPDPQNVGWCCVHQSKRPDIMHKIGTGITTFPLTDTLSLLHLKPLIKIGPVTAVQKVTNCKQNKTSSILVKLIQPLRLCMLHSP